MNFLQTESERTERDLEFVEEIHQLCLKHSESVTNIFIDGLLAVLIKYTDAPFPDCSKTLLNTSRETVIKKMADGEYCHYSLKIFLVKVLNEYGKRGYKTDFVRLSAFIDGAEIFNVSEKSAWVIFCSEDVFNIVGVVGIFYGESKPADQDEFLRDFVDEIKALITNTFHYNNVVYHISCDKMICDTPAKKYVLNIKGHDSPATTVVQSAMLKVL